MNLQEEKEHLQTSLQHLQTDSGFSVFDANGRSGRENNFSCFVEEYFGLQSGNFYRDVRLCQCSYRDMPLNKRYYYKVIATKWQGEKILSYTPKLCEEEIKRLCDAVDFETIGVGDVPDCCSIPGCESFYTDRMLLDAQAYSCKDFQNDRECEDNRLEYRYLEQYRKHVALINGDVIGYCKVSDVIAGHGNFVVFVEESHRRKGIAERLVRSMIQTCLDRQITPMYIVRTENLASVSLAHKAGFRVAQKELVFSSHDPA